MTQFQQTQYEKALAKATIENLHIVGKGTIKATSQKFYAVSSSDGTGCYAVIVAGYTLVCNCPAGRKGQYCKHRALVTATLMEAAKAAQAIIDAEQEADRQAHEAATGHDIFDEDAARAAALPLRRDGGPRLYRDEAPCVMVAMEERATEW